MTFACSSFEGSRLWCHSHFGSSAWTSSLASAVSPAGVLGLAQSGGSMYPSENHLTLRPARYRSCIYKNFLWLESKALSSLTQTL
eukprot:205395-Amphidinium_carterae.1